MLVSPPIDALMRLDLPSPAATADFARTLAAMADTGDVIGLGGTLGTGKTAFARAFINARAEAAHIGPVEVPSPTFTLVQTYEVGNGEIHHFDLYRLERPDDALELGIEDAMSGGIVLIEWPERLDTLLPARALRITFEQGASGQARRAGIDMPHEWRDRIGGGLERWRA